MKQFGNLQIQNEDHFNQTLEFASRIGKREQFMKKVDYLADYGGDPDTIRVTLWPDLAPRSFAFLIEKKMKDGTWDRWFNGGLLYHGPHDNHGDGSGPTFAVCLTPTDGWSIHT